MDASVSSTPPPASHPPRRPHLGLTVTVIVVPLLALAALAALWLTRRRALAEDTRAHVRAAEAGPHVHVAYASTHSPPRQVRLPGEVRAFEQTTLYARVGGYLHSLQVDRGYRVRQGQVLGVVESPETAQQAASAAATLQLQQTIARRYDNLQRIGVVSRQDLDTARAQERVAAANVQSSRQLKRYARLRAPFHGIITARYADPGALLATGTGSTSGALPLVDIARDDRVRITVFLGQDEAAEVRAGTPVTLTTDEQPNTPINATVTLLAGGLDPRTRTMLSEIHIENPEGRLAPGSFVRVTFHLAGGPLPRVPSDAVLIRQGRPAVAVVHDRRVTFVPIEIGADDGRYVQVRTGLHGGELVAVGLPSDVREGEAIQPVPLPTEPAR